MRRNLICMLGVCNVWGSAVALTAGVCSGLTFDESLPWQPKSLQGTLSLSAILSLTAPGETLLRAIDVDRPHLSLRALHLFSQPCKSLQYVGTLSAPAHV
ncbi:hypothetical protein F5Y15DRAFT_64351 [Xylariaceae sp. FL0016]|nr:hypothetical protein F5Y15DRAFT_64351 [Xylariaceae sp. FL0016]